MKTRIITDVIQKMLPVMDNAQIEKLQEVLEHTLFMYEVMENSETQEKEKQDYVEMFLSAKRIEGCSEKIVEIL